MSQPHSTTHRLRSTAALIAAFAAAPLAWADPPAFDRPGIGFASAVLPAGSFAWEQGLPDVERDSEDGLRSTTYAANTLFRYGLTATLEVQLAGSPFNRTTIRGPGLRAHATGAGDTAIALKWAPALDSKTTTLALLGAVSFASGSDAFTNAQTVTSFGASATRDLGDSRSLGFYANVDHAGGENTWTASTSFGFPVHGDVGGYLELARIAGGGSSTSLAGAGMTWTLHERVQFDLSLDAGLTRHSPDLLAGFGVSVFWK